MLQSAHRPLTSEEIVARVNDKNKRSTYAELRRLKKAKRLIRIEIAVTIGAFEMKSPIVVYRIIK